MNFALVRQLVLKDLFLFRWSLAGLALAVPALSLALAVWGGENWSHVGLVLMSNTMIWLGFFLPIGTIAKEKKVFVFSLPIGAREYTAAKLAFVSLTFFGPWLAFVAAMPQVVAGHGALAAGAVVPALLLMGTFAVWLLFTTGVTLVFESLSTTLFCGFLVVVLVFAFIPMMRYVPPEILQHWASPQVVWDGPVLAVVAGQVTLAVLCIVGTFVLQARRRSLI